MCGQIRRAHKDHQWCVLVLDGVGTHVMCPKAMQTFLDSKILVVKMAPHTSADLQPLDRSVFHPVKSAARKGVRRYLLETGGKILDPWELPAVLQDAWVERATAANICSGFRSCGILPFQISWSTIGRASWRERGIP